MIFDALLPVLMHVLELQRKNLKVAQEEIRNE